MAKRSRKSDELVWKDDTGTYKIGYSQHLQQQILKTDRLLLLAVLLLIVMIVVGGLYAYTLVQRIDQLDVLARLGKTAALLL